MEQISREVHTDKPTEKVLPELLTGLTQPLGNYGYTLRTQSENALTYELTYRRWYVWLLVVFLFPIGLLFLFVKEAATLTVTLESTGLGTLVRVTGEGPAKVERAVEVMQI